MDGVDFTLRNYAYPDKGYDGTETFAGVLRTWFPRWCVDAKANGLPKNWGEETAAQYQRHYMERILPLLDPQKPLHTYEEGDFEATLDTLRERYHFTDSTLDHYRNLLWIVYRAGVWSGLFTDQIFWEEIYDPSEHTDAENEAHRAQIRTRLRKSLTKEENLFVLNWFLSLDPETVTGEELGLLFMYFCGTRNNEACGINFGHLYSLKKNPFIHLLDIVQSTRVGSNQVKAGGKTGNAPRTLLILDLFWDFLMKRKKFLEQKVASGELILPSECSGKIENLPVVCKGNNYEKRCSTKDLSVAGRAFFEKLGIRKGDLAELHRMLRGRMFQDAEIDEKEVTTYLLRRNLGTILYILGFSQSDIQYYMGHDVEDPDTARDHYTNLDKLMILKEKLNDHPLYAVTHRELTVDFVEADKLRHLKRDAAGDVLQICADGKTRHIVLDIETNEPNDSVSLLLESLDPDAAEGFDVTVDVSGAMRPYSKTVNLRQLFRDNYIQSKEN